MEPTLCAGDRTIFRYFPTGLHASDLARAIGKIVLIRRSSQPQLLTVKRVIKVLDTGLWVEGDNPSESTDSRQYLTIAPDEVVGIYLIRYKRGPSSTA